MIKIDIFQQLFLFFNKKYKYFINSGIFLSLKQHEIRFLIDKKNKNEKKLCFYDILFLKTKKTRVFFNIFSKTAFF